MRADVVVIGAGALGLSTALQCALRGRSVVIVERHLAGSQASGRAAGLFKAIQADELRTALARSSIEKAISFGDWAGVPLEVARSGSFLIARTARHKEFIRAEASQSRGWGADVSEAARGDVASRVSYYRESGDELAIWCPSDIYISEPMSLVRAYVAACRLHGVELLERDPAVGVLVSAGRVTGVEVAGRLIRARDVVDAAGAWARQVAELAGGWLPVAPVRHQLLITAPSPEVDPAGPIARVADAAVYLRPARGGLMFGGFETAPLPVDPRAEAAPFSTADVPLDLDVLRRLAGQVAAEAPLAAEGPVAEHRGGLFTMSPDGRFIAGPVPDVPGLWAASGCNGSGFSSSLAIGAELAEWITAGSPPRGLAALAPGRFGAMTDDVLIERGIWQYERYYEPAGASPVA